ncbi:MAG: helix-turn-helix transcriptional regulator [Pseudonocardiaceae bacterium]|nr:MAG: helix-turn-helix transcriptional regulator [Pseudonocardiaceae bacterium]
MTPRPRRSWPTSTPRAPGRGASSSWRARRGAGKSRLLRHVADAAVARGLPVLTGRAVPGGSPLPFRPLSEAVLVAGRRLRSGDVPDLVGFDGALARLAPDAAAPPATAAESPVLVAEAVVRLLRHLGRDHGCLLVLEDLHWADAETLAVAAYLADTLADEPVLCLTSARPGTGPVRTALLDRLPRGGVLDLGPLGADACTTMVAACLRTDDPDPALGAFVAGHCDGLPFMVEELLAGLVSDGTLVRDAAGWHVTGPLTPQVPRSLAESVRSRLDQLPPKGIDVLGAAATLGRRFEWELLPGVAAVDGAVAVDVLRAAVALQLVTVDGTRFRFRHALSREAVLAELLPPERAAMAGRALVAVERGHPGLPAEWCELAGSLAETAGRPGHAAALAVESARRAHRRGALGTAEAAARRARALVPPGTPVAADADESLARTLAEAGRPVEAREAAARALPLLGDDPGRAADLLLVTTRAAIAAGSDDAAALLEAARDAAARAPADDAVAARLDAVGAHIALAAADTATARALAARAVDTAVRAGAPDVECEALEVLGRTGSSQAERTGVFERIAATAERHAMPHWRIRALHETALTTWGPAGRRRVAEVRRLAVDAGALVTVAQMDLVRADRALSVFDAAACLDAATRCAEASRRYGLASLPVALLWLAGGHALTGDVAATEAAIAHAEDAAPGDPRILADAWGRVRARLAQVRGDRAAQRAALDRSMGWTRVAPRTESVYPGQFEWAVLCAIDDDDLGAAARAEIADSMMARNGFDAPVLLSEAVAHGRCGRAAQAAEAVARTRENLARLGVQAWAIQVMLLVAEAAVRDGWGDPATWLRESEAHFVSVAQDGLAQECRALLRRVGAPVPRRRAGDPDVPAELRGMGVTGREFEVLVLIADGLTTREIADRLVLSPRTVEHHASRLLARTGRRSRAELADLLRQTG